MPVLRVLLVDRWQKREDIGVVTEALAINGGSKTVPDGLVQEWPPITEEDRKAVLAVLDSGHLHGAGAPQVLALQKEWADYCGVKHCLVTNSGTSALHMALAGAGVQPGDEVIVPAYTYWATAAAVLHHNAIPVFVDIEPETFCLDPELIEEKITANTKALLPVHVHGVPADMDAINGIASRHGLMVIEDAAQAHGATYKGRMAGSLAHAAGFSLNRGKNLTSGEGGLYTTDDDNAYEYGMMMREFGEVIVPGEKREYNAYALGWMYRPVEFCNAMARSQLRRLDEYNAQRREMAAYLDDALRSMDGCSPVASRPECQEVYWTYTFRLQPEELGLEYPPTVLRDAVERALLAEGVPVWQWQQMPVPAQDVFQSREGYGRGCPWTCRFGRQVEYRAEDYPRTVEFLATHLCLRGVWPPNDLGLMKLFVKGFEKVMAQAGDLVAVEAKEAAS
jgi:dTDP-4-amino-4,6-dideoxygalactose transaminase